MNEYSTEIANHYAVYRPPLHQIILRMALENSSHDVGLDIGCGTGQSSIALTPYCTKVIGLDPSYAMLKFSLSNPKVTYLHFDGIHLPFPDDTFEITTFAGSLFYAKSQLLLNEVIRVSRRLSTMLIYDFEVMLNPWFALFNIPISESKIPYDHQIDFSGLNLSHLERKEKTNSTFSFSVKPEELAHLLLSTKSSYASCQRKYQTEDPYPSLLNQLLSTSDQKIELKADLYFTKYTCDKSD